MGNRIRLTRCEAARGPGLGFGGCRRARFGASVRVSRRREVVGAGRGVPTSGPGGAVRGPAGRGVLASLASGREGRSGQAGRDGRISGVAEGAGGHFAQGRSAGSATGRLAPGGGQSAAGSRATSTACTGTGGCW